MTLHKAATTTTTIASPRLFELGSFHIKTGVVLRLLICLIAAAFCLYQTIALQNEITQLQIEIPQLVKKTELIAQDNERLTLEIQKLESPSRLIEMMAQFPSLKQPSMQEVITLSPQSVDKTSF